MKSLFIVSNLTSTGSGAGKAGFSDRQGVTPGVRIKAGDEPANPLTTICQRSHIPLLQQRASPTSSPAELLNR